MKCPTKFVACRCNGPGNRLLAVKVLAIRSTAHWACAWYCWAVHGPSVWSVCATLPRARSRPFCRWWHELGRRQSSVVCTSQTGSWSGTRGGVGEQCRGISLKCRRFSQLVRVEQLRCAHLPAHTLLLRLNSSMVTGLDILTAFGIIRCCASFSIRIWWLVTQYRSRISIRHDKCGDKQRSNLHR